jgi:hypothetical protein
MTVSSPPHTCGGLFYTIDKTEISISICRNRSLPKELNRNQNPRKPMIADTAESVQQCIFSIAKKGINDYRAQEAIAEMVASMLHELGILKGNFVLCTKARVPSHGGSSPHVRVRYANASGVSLVVQIGTENDSRYECFLAQQSVKPKELHARIVKGLTDNTWWKNGKPKEQKLAPIATPVSTPVVAKEQPQLPVPVATTGVPAQTPDRIEFVPERHSYIVGFTRDETNVGLLILEIKEKHGTGEITGERFSQIMRDGKFCPQGTPNRASGQVLAWLRKEGFITKRWERGITFYRLSEKALSLVDTKSEQATPPAPKAEVIAHPVVIQQGLDKLLADIGKFDAMEKELTAAKSELATCKAEIVRLEGLLKPATALRDRLSGRISELETVFQSSEFENAKLGMESVRHLQKIGALKIG